MTRPGRCSTPGHQDRPAVLFARGWCCEQCAPPQPPPTRYCLAICYCGTCPHYGGAPLAPGGDTIIDIRHKASGKRRSSPQAHAGAVRHTRKGP